LQVAEHPSPETLLPSSHASVPSILLLPQIRFPALELLFEEEEAPQPAIEECAHPVEVLQVSVVQAFESLQFVAAPGWHDPFEHASPVVQALESEQVVVLFVCTHTAEALQVSVVHAFASSQPG